MSKVTLFMSMQLIKLVWAIVLLTLCGCIPAYYTYWVPTSQGGRLFYSAAGSIAPSNTIEFTFSGVKINFSGNGTGVGMALIIPKGRVVSFTSDIAELNLPEQTKIRFDVASTDATTLTRLHFNPTGPLTRDFYVAEIEFGKPEKERYRIKLPAIKIDDQLYDIPEVEFTRKKGFGVFGP